MSSFDQNIRASGNFQRQFARTKRRIALSEIPKSDIDQLQEHVNELRTYTHFINVENTISNADVAIGPNDYIFEPDYDTVKIRTAFEDVSGIDYQFQTLNSSFNYYSLELYDQASTTAQMWYAVSQADAGTTDNIFDLNELWNWKVNTHPPQLRRGNSISLNELGNNSRQFIYLSNLGTHFDYTAQKISLGFWIYPTSVASSGSPKVIAYRRVDANNKWSIELDTDSKLYTAFRVAGVDTKRQYDTALSANNWYFICINWDPAGPTLALKVNDLADTSSTKTTGTAPTDPLFYFGSYPGASIAQDFNGYITGITYYKQSSVLTSAQMTSLYNYDTKAATIVPMLYGFGKYG